MILNSNRAVTAVLLWAAAAVSQAEASPLSLPNLSDLRRLVSQPLNLLPLLNKNSDDSTSSSEIEILPVFNPSEGSSFKDHDSCPIDSPLSCTLPYGEDSCCYEASNGLFLATQFWDYNPATGPDDLFTIHGLWSNKCLGGYDQFCNPSWKINNATAVLEDLGYTDLLKEMQYAWKDISGRDADLWEHEFNKHGTCMYTLNPKCYGPDTHKYQYVGDFFTTVVNIHKKLPTYQFLNESGIVPTADRKYKKQDIIDAIEKHTGGHSVKLACTRSGALQEVWYFFHLKGSVAGGSFHPIDNPYAGDSCPDELWYYPKTGPHPRPPPEHPGRPGKPGNPGVPGAPTSRGYLKLEGQDGCLISSGNWFLKGTCATFRKRAARFGGITLSSSKGNCDVVNGKFSCARNNEAGQFTEQEDGSIVYGGETLWHADKKAESYAQVPISPGKGGSIEFSLKFESK